MSIKRALSVLFQNLVRLPRLLINVACIVATALLIPAITSIVANGAFSTSSAHSAHAFAASISSQDYSIGRGQTAPNCIELVVNGGFEQSAVGWSPMAGASLFTYATDRFVGGRHSLLLGFGTPLNLPATFGVDQFLTLPAESSSIKFSFAYDLRLEGEVGSGDQAYLTIFDAATNQLSAMLILSPTSADEGEDANADRSEKSSSQWTTGRYDLTPLAGKNVRLGFSVQNDGEPGRLAMYVDDVSILACLPIEAFALQPLDIPEPPTAEPLLLTPQPLPTPTQETSPLPQETPVSPQTQTLFPQVEGVDSLAACSCSRNLYTCADFANWSEAQACYTQCQVNTGYDIHNLDEDGNGIACELELVDLSSSDATPEPQATPSPLAETGLVNPSAAVAIAGAVTSTVAVSIATTDTTTVVANQPMTESLTLSLPVTVAEAAAPDTSVASDITPIAAVGASLAAPATSLTSIEMLTLLLFSPLGFIALGTLVVVGSLSLWAAYMIGQRGRATKEEASKKTASDEFGLLPSDEAPAPKT